MSLAPFDGVLLEDLRPPVTGAMALLLHLRVARALARTRGWAGPALDAVKARAQACQELLAQGLFPERLRALGELGLDLGDPRQPHSLASLASHFEAYLAEVAREGCLEPDEALWRATDAQLEGGRGLWVERGPEDGPIQAGLRDLLPVRLRALACVPELAGARFALATRRGGARSGLFGGPQPLVEWFLDGLEQHGQGFPNEIELAEPEGWGAAPWSGALDGLFEGPLELGAEAGRLQRGLAEGPVDLLRQAVEQVCAWLAAGIAPRDITVIHPEPQRVAAFLAPLLAEEGVALHVRGGLLPLIDSEAWCPLWMVLNGLARLDPAAASAGLRAARRRDLRQWAEELAAADQVGAEAFETSFIRLAPAAKDSAMAVWRDLAGWRQASAAAADWAGRIEALAGTLRLPTDPDDFFAPLGLLKDLWGAETWTFEEMLLALRAFLETARSARVPRAPDGVRLVAPGTLLDDWSGAAATLILDLAEGAWPASRAANPDLDWNRKAAINAALLRATQLAGEAAFPPALQRFWLPRAEHGDQTPRAFQQEAYAFNKVLAMTRERLVALSPAQDAEGRTRGQGPFWTALEGAGAWAPDPARAASLLRWRWEGRAPDSRARERAGAAQVQPPEQALAASGPGFDRCPGARAAWLGDQDHFTPTALEVLARCPFRSMAERVWKLRSASASGQMAMAVGTLVHRLLEEALKPFVDQEGWPALLLAAAGTGAGGDPEPLRAHLQALWEAGRQDWLAGLRRLQPEQWPQASLDLEGLLPAMAQALMADAEAGRPSNGELAFLFPELLPWADVRKTKDLPLQTGWTRILVALERTLEPLALDLGAGRSMRVAGQLDRLELWRHEGGTEFLRVTDYKTTPAASLKPYAAEGAPFAEHLQTPLYILMAEAAFHLPATATLVPLRGDDHKPFVGHLRTLAGEAGPEDWKLRLKDNLARFDARLEAGDFPPTPGAHCQYCELGALCGRPVDLAAGTEEED